MTELRQSEINLDELKSSIRKAVARREAEGRTPFVKASVELFELLTSELLRTNDLSVGDYSASADVFPDLDFAPLTLQPAFVPHSDDHYHVDDLLRFHGVQFIWNAYRALLKREPDEEGLRTHLAGLQSGRFNKIDVLASLRSSPEGRRNNVAIDGLRSRSMVRRLYSWPVLGYFIELAVGIARLPSLIQHQRQSENYLIAQQEGIVDHFNRGVGVVVQEEARLGESISQFLAELRESFSRSLSELHDSFARAFSDLAKEQRRIAYLQHQQLTALFREQQKASRDLVSQNGRRTGDGESLNEQRQNAGPSLGRSERDELQAHLQDELRGSRESVKENLKVYLPLLNEAEIDRDILDLGCGRGEWLELLREKGVEARGVEVNHEMVKEARAQDLEVFEENILTYLRQLPDQILNAVTGFHLIEHLSFETLIELLDETKRTLRPGGLVIFETPNPKNLTVAACNFYADPGHHRPVFPETIEFILKHKGFEQVRLEYLNPIEDSPFRNNNPGSRELDIWFFGPRDFAVIAQKAGRILTSKQDAWDKKSGASKLVLQVPVEDQLETVNLVRQVSQSGHRFYARPGTDDEKIFQDVVEVNEYSLPSKFTRQDVVIDVGAHIGSFSYTALKRGAGATYAYEAHPVNYAIACKNLEEFGDRVNCNNLAVWRSDIPGQILFNDRIDDRSDPNTGGHAVVYNNEGIPVQTISLDEILLEASDRFRKKIRVLKIDCEGAEYPILFTSKHLDIIEEICGEYHEVPSQTIPDRAKVSEMADRFNGDALKEFLERAGWAVEIQANSQNPRLGRFRARR